MKTPHLGQVFSALGQPGIMAGAPQMWFLDATLYGSESKGVI
jgi:hypothetical protein